MKKCLVCGKETQKKFPQHLRQEHNLSIQEYYDQYIKTESEGICVVCGNPVKFNPKLFAYAKTCSKSCTFKNIHNEIRDNEEKKEKWAEHSRQVLKKGWENPEQRKKWTEQLSELAKKRSDEGFNPNPKAGQGRKRRIEIEDYIHTVQTFYCPYCSFQYTGVSSRALKEHMIQEHNILEKNWVEFLRNVYWPKFFPEKTTHCLVCKKPTSFHDFGYGFSIVCSISCQQLLLDYCDLESARNRLHIIELEKQMLSGVNYLLSKNLLKITVIQNNLNIPFLYDTSEARKLIKLSTDLYRKEKTTQICLEKYGVEHHSKAQEIKDKKRETCLERYGYYTNLQDPQQQERISKTVREKYSINRILQGLFHKRMSLLSSTSQFVEEKYLKLQCNLCGHEFEYVYDSQRFNVLHCPSCYQEKHSSSHEDFICDFLNSYNIEYTRHERKLYLTHPNTHPSEVDIYIPKYNIGIEVDGLYWHSNGDPKQHIRKTLEFKKVYNSNLLLHITDSEINLKPEIVKSIVLAKCGIFHKRIPARKCEIRKIEDSLYKSFTNNTHIQGYASATTALGAFYKNELVAICSFGSARTPKDERREVELIRFCCLPYTQIIGGLSKFVKFFLKNYPSAYNLMSFCDLRYASTAGYLASGFVPLYNTPPRYWYWSSKEPWLHNRRSFQRKYLEKSLPNFDPDLSEYDNCLNNGWYRYYDCGSVKMLYQPTL